MLDVRDLRYVRDGRAVLDGLSLAVRPGEMVALVGANGAGKSTLLRCIGGFLRPQGGTVAIDGADAARLSRDRLARLLAYVPQHAGEPASLPVADMVALGRAPHRGRSTPARDRAVVLDCLDRLDLAELALRPFDAISGGERRRAMIARALAQQTPLLLLDEPTSDLDLRHQLQAMTLLRAVADGGAAVLVAIHDLALAGRFADRLALLDGGRIAAEGPWRQVLTPALLEPAYGVGVCAGEWRGRPHVAPVTRAEAAE